MSLVAKLRNWFMRPRLLPVGTRVRFSDEVTGAFPDYAAPRGVIREHGQFRDVYTVDWSPPKGPDGGFFPPFVFTDKVVEV